MKIGLYNRFWNTYGGGEKHIGSIAEVLSKDHQVELISVEPVDWNLLQSRLQLDLSLCTVRECSSANIVEYGKISMDYQLFINSTYGSSMMPLSPLSVYMCFFPHIIDNSWNIRQLFNMLFSRWRLSSSRKYLMRGEGVMVPVYGFYPIESDGMAWFGEDAMISLSGIRGNEVDLRLWMGAHNGIYDVEVNGDKVSWRITEQELHISVKDAAIDEYRIRIRSKLCAPVNMDTRQLGGCVNTRNHHWLGDTQLVDSNIALSQYNKIIANSSFTSGWITKRWGLPSTVLYSPIDMENFPFSYKEKERIILSVGRFFNGNNNKKQKEIALAFIKMTRDGIIPDCWRLILAGARHKDNPEQINYFVELEEICRGHDKIEIRPDLAFLDLRDCYKRASIYWHASGWGENESVHPENFEHFGITTCEAMASGCIPVVYDAAGQREIVYSEEVGYRYSDYQTLTSYMEVLTKADPKTLEVMRLKVRSSIERYSSVNFKERVHELLRGICY
ncbi:MAG: glycosyltransferase [Nitrosospira sp.]|nr:glycosyltransferase [Nitrosospira sp.]